MRDGMPQNGLLLGFLLAGLSSAPAVADAPAELKALAEARLKIARRMFDAVEESYKNPPKALEEEQRLITERVDRLVLWSGRWMEAQLETSGNKGDRVAAVKAQIQRLKTYEERYREIANVGVHPYEAR